MSATFPYLSTLIGLPLIGAMLVLMLDDADNPNRARFMALAVALASMALCIPMYQLFDTTTATMQFAETHEWIGLFNVSYRLGVDGISFALIMLTTFTTLLVVLAAWRSVKEKIAQYLAAFLVMQAMMIGVFAALDAILFYFFWEGVLIPMYLSIGIWGSKNRSYASIKFFLYTFLGSALMLIALLYVGMKAGDFSFAALYNVKLSLNEQLFIFMAFFMAFAVKVPMWPVHTWLPDAHTEAPTGGSVILAAIMLKMGGYGFLRLSLPITPDACMSLYTVMMVLSLIAVIYIGFVALAQTDMKRLIAYSSIAHMGFATLGTFLIFGIAQAGGAPGAAVLGLEGAIFQMVSHAFSSGALFIGVGALYDRLHTRQIKDFGGVVNTMPWMATAFLVFAMANTGLPGTSGFVGEFMVILSAWQASFWVMALAATTVILSAAYTLWMYKRVFFGEIVNKPVANLTDLIGTEKIVFGLLVALLIGLGVYPQALLELLHASVEHLIQLSLTSKL